MVSTGRGFAAAVLCTFGLAGAVCGQTITRANLTSTSPASLVTLASTLNATNATGSACKANCQRTVRPPVTGYWSKATVTGNLTAATVFVVVDNRTNVTSTRTQLANLPSGVTRPPTGPDGTRIWVYPTTTTSGNVTLTTNYTLKYGDELGWVTPTAYSWLGTVPTTSHGTATCKTQVDWTVINFSRPYPPTPEARPFTPDANDPYGLLYMPRHSTSMYAGSWPSGLADNDTVYQLCSMVQIGPVEVVQTARLVTITSVSTIDSGESASTLSATSPSAAAAAASAASGLMTPSLERSRTSTAASTALQPPPSSAAAAAAAAPPSSTAPVVQTSAASSTQPLSSTSAARTSAGAITQPLTSTTVRQTSASRLVAPPDVPAPVPAAASSSFSFQPLTPAPAPAPAQVAAGGVTFTSTSSGLFVAPNGQSFGQGATVFVGSSAANPTPIVLTTNSAGSSVFIVLPTGATSPGAGAVTVPIVTTAPDVQSGTVGPGTPLPVPAPAPAAPTLSPVVIGGQALTPIAGGQLVAQDGQTVRPGSTITISNGAGSPPTAVVLTTDSKGSSALIVNTASGAPPATITINITPSTAPAAPVVVAGQSLISTSGGQLVAQDGQTLRPGATITLAASIGETPAPVVLTTDTKGSSVLIVNSGGAGTSTTVTLPAAAPIAPLAPITIGGQTLLPVGGGQFVAPNGQTLQSGSTLTIGGGSGVSPTAVLLTANAAGSTVLVVSSRGSIATIAVPTATGPPASEITVGEGTFKSTSGGQIIAPNGQVIGQGSTLSLPGSGVGGRPTAVAVTTDSLGATILLVGGFAADGGLAPTTTVTLPAATASRAVVSVISIDGALKPATTAKVTTTAGSTAGSLSTAVASATARTTAVSNDGSHWNKAAGLLVASIVLCAALL